jgi:hypothetical protein
MTMTVESLLSIALSNPVNAQIVARLPSLGLNQCMLTAGCLFQAVWNQRSGQPAAWGVNDYDVFYFDEDRSWEAENDVINATRILFQDLGVNVEVRNQARVHLWFSERFGSPYPALSSAKQGVDRFLVASTCIGVEIETNKVYAPYGLAELEQGILRINPHFQQPDLFRKKSRDYQARWPWLTIHETGEPLEPGQHV